MKTTKEILQGNNGIPDFIIIFKNNEIQKQVYLKKKMKKKGKTKVKKIINRHLSLVLG